MTRSNYKRPRAFAGQIRLSFFRGFSSTRPDGGRSSRIASLIFKLDSLKSSGDTSPPISIRRIVLRGGCWGANYSITHCGGAGPRISDNPARNGHPLPQEHHQVPHLRTGLFLPTALTDACDLASRWSSWPKLIRVTAYLYRFADRCRRTKTHAL